MEEWRFIPGFEGLYQISESGRVRSVDRTVVGKDGKARRFSGLEVRPYKNKAGYLSIRLTRLSPRMIHRLVAETFIGPAPEGAYVCHEDGVRDHNHHRNLRYDTPLGNQADRERHGTHVRGSALAHAKLTEADIPVIRRRLANGDTQEAVAADYGVSRPAITLIHIGKNWRHVPVTEDIDTALAQQALEAQP